MNHNRCGYYDRVEGRTAQRWPKTKMENGKRLRLYKCQGCGAIKYFYDEEPPTTGEERK